MSPLAVGASGDEVVSTPGTALGAVLLTHLVVILLSVLVVAALGGSDSVKRGHGGGKEKD